jgi:V8-like Glu-specific endopeptidase
MASEPAELARQAHQPAGAGYAVGPGGAGRPVGSVGPIGLVGSVGPGRRVRFVRPAGRPRRLRAGGRPGGRPGPGHRPRSRWKRGALATAAGVSLATAFMIATPLSKNADTLADGPQPMPSSSLLPAMDAQAVPFSGTPAIGALFTTRDGSLLGHFCSASVVASPQRDLLITAAHCVTGAAMDSIAFVPGYDDGRIPYGIWPITRVIVGQGWASNADPNEDVAFLITSGPVQATTGGERLGVGLPAGHMVSVIGYPQTANGPIRCDNLALEFSSADLEFDCGGYTDGTSGSPLLENVSPSTGLGTVIGVIGGYEQGGYTPSVSYADRFGSLVADLYKTATRQP